MDAPQQQPIQPIAPNALLVVRLEAQHWNVVMSVLAEQPYKVAAPIIHQIGEQLQQQAQAYQQPPSPQPLARNGHDRETSASTSPEPANG